MSLEKNNVVQDLALKTRRQVFEISITGNATPANKVHATDLPGVAVLRSEGKTAEADAIETISWTSAIDDTDSVFGVLLKGSELGDIKKVLSCKVSETSTSLASALAVTKHGVGGKTTGGNIAFSITGTGLDLNSESPKIVCEVEYLLAE
jgi:hypothetical protein